MMESGLLFPYLQQQQQQSSFLSFPFLFSSLEEEHHPLHDSIARSNQVQTTVSAYDLGGDLFKAPEPIMEEPGLKLDPMAMVSIISSEEDIAMQGINVSDISSTQTGHLSSKTSTSTKCFEGAGDLFKAPTLTIEEHILGYDPMTAAISDVPYGEEVISSEMVEAANVKSFQIEHLLSELSFEWKELMTKSVMDVTIPVIMKEEDSAVEMDEQVTGSPMHKSFSSGSLSSVDYVDRRAMRPRFLDFRTMNLGAALGMRRAFSEGDIQTLANGNALGHSPLGQMLTIGCYTSEERKLRISRYKIKKAKRNFGRKIKYECRKALAESQPRVRGRFAKTEETRISNTNEKQSRGGLFTLKDAVEGVMKTENAKLRLGR